MLNIKRFLLKSWFSWDLFWSVSIVLKNHGICLMLCTPLGFSFVRLLEGSLAGRDRACLSLTGCSKEREGTQQLPEIVSNYR